jgi:hypothetical protein
MSAAAIRPWDRLPWGVVFTSQGLVPPDPPMLLGTAWDSRQRSVPSTEPTRPLLFRTRAQCREWCREQNAKWREHPSLDTWSVRPTQVRELVSVR